MLLVLFVFLFLKHLKLSQTVYLEEYNVDVPEEVYAKTKNYAVGFSEPQSADQQKKRYKVEKNLEYDDLLNFVFQDETYTVKCVSGKSLPEGKCDNSTQATEVLSVRESKAKTFLCYYSNWSRYFIKFLPQHIPTDLCTHVIYSFFPITDDYEVRYSDHWADIQLNAIREVVSLKNRGVVKKVLLSIGGWTYSGPDLGRWFDDTGREGRNSKPFKQIWHDLLTNARNRKTFIASLKSFMDKHQFDGVELDYEYPACPWGECLSEYKAQKVGFENLIKEMRTSYGLNKHISVATSANIRVIPNGPNVAILTPYLDFFSVMTYDYNVYLPNSKSGHNQPKNNVTDTIEYYINVLKIDSSKVLIGVSFYGRGYVVSEDDKRRAVQANSFAGIQSLDGSPAMDQTQQLGTANIYELCKMKICNGGTGGLNSKPSCHDNDYQSGDCEAMGFYTNDQDGSWLVYDNVLMAYTDIRDLKVLSQIRSKYNLGGYLIYAIDKDDFKGDCNLNGNFPFMRALYNDRLSGDNLLWKPRLVEGDDCDDSPEETDEDGHDHHHHGGGSIGGSCGDHYDKCNRLCNCIFSDTCDATGGGGGTWNGGGSNSGGSSSGGGNSGGSGSSSGGDGSSSGGGNIGGGGSGSSSGGSGSSSGGGSSGGGGSSSGGINDSINIHDTCKTSSNSNGGSQNNNNTNGPSNPQNKCYDEADCKANTMTVNLCNTNNYFVCTAGRFYEMSCPTGLVFNNVAKLCDYPLKSRVLSEVDPIMNGTSASDDENDNAEDGEDDGSEVGTYAGVQHRHGFSGSPASRASLCSKNVNKDCGGVQYEPQSIEAPKGFPNSGPPDGHIASGGIQRFYKLDETGDRRWFKHNLRDYYKKYNSTHWVMSIDYTYTAEHRTSGYDLFATYNNYSFNLPLARKYLRKISTISTPNQRPLDKLNFLIQGDKIEQGGVLLLVWIIADTGAAFYSVIDYCY